MFHYSSDFMQLRLSSPVLKLRNLSLKRRKSTTKVDEIDGLFETDEVDDDLPATQRFVSPQKSLANYHPDEAFTDDVLLCDTSSILSLF